MEVHHPKHQQITKYEHIVLFKECLQQQAAKSRSPYTILGSYKVKLQWCLTASLAMGVWLRKSSVIIRVTSKL